MLKKCHIVMLCLGVGIVLGVLYCRPWLFYSLSMRVQKNHNSATQQTKGQSVGSVKKVCLNKNIPLKVPVYVWPPFNYKNRDGKWIGADVEITTAVLKRMGYRIEPVDMPFKRILLEMKKGTYPAMFPCVIGGGRETFLYFSEPVSSIYSVLWKKSSDSLNWQSYDDLKGRTIGASFYHYGAGFFEAAKAGKFKLDMVASQSPELIHFQKLLQDKTDMFICEQSVGLFLKQKHAPLFDNISYSEKGVGSVRPFCFALSRQYFKGHENEMIQFMNEFNTELRNFAREGKRSEIFKSYHMKVLLDEQGQVVVPKGGR